MKKQVLIDSLYINNSGGLRLLDYLIRELLNKSVDFFLLADMRIKGRYDQVANVEYMDASLKKRHKFYKNNRDRFASVLCFGNVPPPIKLNVPVYTYFHNVNRLNVTIYHSKKKVLLSWMKRIYINSLKKHTNKWIVQTTYTKSELLKHFNEDDGRVLIMPFYELPDDSNVTNHAPQVRTDYCFVGAYTGNKGHDELLEAWKILHDKGMNLTLHLTVDKANTAFAEKERDYDFEQLGIINHGFIPFEKVMEIYHQSKAIIYPSKNESLGLGLIEAIHYGCDVISSDLPYTYAVCEPSGVFDPVSPNSIADAIINYEKGKSPKSRLTIKDYINEIIELLQ